MPQPRRTRTTPPPPGRPGRPPRDPVSPEPPLVDEPAAEEKKEAPRPRRAAPLQARCERFFLKIADGLELVGDEYCALIMRRRAEPLGKAWAELAQENPQVRRLLTASVETGAWGGVALATGVTVAPMILHHLPPDALASLPGPFGAILGGGAGPEAGGTPAPPEPPSAPPCRPEPVPAEPGPTVGQATQPLPPREPVAPPPASVSVRGAERAASPEPAPRAPEAAHPDLGVEYQGAGAPILPHSLAVTPNGNPHSGAPGPAATSR